MRCGMHTQNYPRTVVGLPQTNCPLHKSNILVLVEDIRIKTLWDTCTLWEFNTRSPRLIYPEAPNNNKCCQWVHYVGTVCESKKQIWEKKGKGRESRVDSFCSHAKWRMHSLKFKAKIVDCSKSCRVVGNNRCNRFVSVIASYGSPSVSTFIHWVLKESSIPSIWTNYNEARFCICFGYVIPFVSAVSSSSSKSNI